MTDPTPTRRTRTAAEKATDEVERARRLLNRALTKLGNLEADVAVAKFDVDALKARLAYAEQNPALQATATDGAGTTPMPNPAK